MLVSAIDALLVSLFDDAVLDDAAFDDAAFCLQCAVFDAMLLVLPAPADGELLDLVMMRHCLLRVSILLRLPS